jgi:SAM-dependent methyltransferase
MIALQDSMQPTQDHSFEDWKRQCSLPLSGRASYMVEDHDPEGISAKAIQPELGQLGMGRVQSIGIRDKDEIQDHVTFQTAVAMRSIADRVRGKTVWDIGCGTGLLPIFAKRMGAAQALGTDIAECCVGAARENASLNQVECDFRMGDLLDPVRGQKADLIIANLPQKPGDAAHHLPLSQYGGVDGMDLQGPFNSSVHEYLNPGGALLLFMHSLANPKILEILQKRFSLRPIVSKRRYFSSNEFDLDYYRSRHLKRLSFVGSDELTSAPYFACTTILATLKSPTLH